MLNTSLIKHRVRDLREFGFCGNAEYQYYTDISHEVYLYILKKYIPEEQQFEFDRFFFEYDLASESAQHIFAEEAYKQGLIDGMELSKILN